MLTLKPNYEVSLGDINTLATVAGYGLDKNKAYPSINSSAHEDEFYFNVALIGADIVDKPVLSDGVAEFISKGMLQRYFVNSDGSMEWEIVMAEKPASNVVELRVKHSGLSFTKQVITLEHLEIMPGAAYSYDWSKDSISVYCNKRNNGYRTGRVGCIRRAWLRDSKGAFTWLDMNIYPDGFGQERLVIIFPSDFIDKATKPLTFGPSIGYEDQGALNSTINSLFGFRPVQLGALGGEVTALKWWNGLSSSGVAKAALCNTSGVDHMASGQALVVQGKGQPQME